MLFTSNVHLYRFCIVFLSFSYFNFGLYLVAIFPGLSMSWLFLLEYLIEGLMNILLMWINCFSWVGGSPCFKQSSIEFSIKSGELDYFLNLVNLIKGVTYRFSNELGYQISYEFLIEYQKIKTHWKICDDYHVSTFLDRDVT